MVIVGHVSATGGGSGSTATNYGSSSVNYGAGGTSSVTFGGGSSVNYGGGSSFTTSGFSRTATSREISGGYGQNISEYHIDGKLICAGQDSGKLVEILFRDQKIYLGSKWLLILCLATTAV
ncbi:hypothetical protein AVEN_13522-1 [Araneus ventricosus]|uniref:Uncharacterized protein n=1 Tax=Araneus ventricosus TaxID=182803 RepID=A0A4Y2LNM2_ARAVE|nr:hypothetical protein AVEN_13522-1 [Araneus ventricosus]